MQLSIKYFFKWSTFMSVFQKKTPFDINHDHIWSGHNSHYVWPFFKTDHKMIILVNADHLSKKLNLWLLFKKNKILHVRFVDNLFVFWPFCLCFGHFVCILAGYYTVLDGSLNHLKLTWNICWYLYLPRPRPIGKISCRQYLSKLGFFREWSVLEVL